MELAAEVEEGNDTSRAPRYLAVKKVSATPNENELLFCGKRVKLKITNIILSGTNQGHRAELRVLNNIQNLLSNGRPSWNRKDVDLFQQYCRRRHGWKIKYVFTSSKVIFCQLLTCTVCKFNINL